jgi:type II secretory pathway component PulF
MNEHALPLLRWFCLWGLPGFAITAGAALLLNLPTLRTSRAKFFLELLNLGLRRGQSPEHAIVDASATRDPSLGARFHLLAEWIRSGVAFPEALRLSPSLVPHQIAAMLGAGSEAGVLPGAIRAALRATRFADAQLRAAISCQIVMLFILNPLILVSMPYFLLKVFPVIGEISAGIGNRPPGSLRLILAHSKSIFIAQAASVALLYLCAVVYVGGNRFTRWIEAGLYPLSAWVALKIPWKRKRLHRDFATMFALLLDAGLPETRALELAAESTGNEIFEARAAAALDELRHGASLIAAFEILDPPGEFNWRLANALRRKGNFTGALEGWFETLDAEADAQEQSAGDLFSTVLLVANGLIVALIIAAVMQTIYGFSMFPIR